MKKDVVIQTNNDIALLYDIISILQVLSLINFLNFARVKDLEYCVFRSLNFLVSTIINSSIFMSFSIFSLYTFDFVIKYKIQDNRM